MSESSGLISLRLAMSLDGYIADEEGGYDWILPVASPTLDTDHQLPFDEFLDDVDLVVMGRRCYDQGQHRDYVALGKKVIVATSTRSGPEQREQGIDFVGNGVVEVVRAARDQGQHCFLFGGGVLVESFLAADAVDMLTIGIVPVLLGGGRPLFPGDHPTLELTLTDYAVHQGKVRLVYERR
jgi:dihydrofolate reductase